MSSLPVVERGQPITDLALIHRRFFDLATNLQGLYDTLKLGIDRYIRLIYPISPIVSCSSLRQRFEDQQHLSDRNFASLVLAASSVALFAPGCDPHDEAIARVLMDYTLCTQTSSFHRGGTSLDLLAATIMTGGLLRTEYGDDAAYVKMRESIGLAEILQLDRAVTYAGLAEEDREAVLSLFWQLAVGEK
jgi:hypothetical protein